MLEIKPETLDLYAYTNGAILEKPALGLVLDFHGLGGGGPMPTEDSEPARWFAQRQVLYVFPYYGPWSWMNDVAVKTVDAVAAAALEKYGLSEGAPIISTGGSMGGLSALVYARYAARPVAACAANCPVCDLSYHATERKDLPRTMRVAFGHYACGLEEAMTSASPLHLAPQMPAIPYLIVHGEADKAVNKAMHSDRFVKAMAEAGKPVEYIGVSGMPHCQMDPELTLAYRRFILNHATDGKIYA